MTERGRRRGRWNHVLSAGLDQRVRGPQRRPAGQFVAASEKTRDYLASQPGTGDTVLHQAIIPGAAARGRFGWHAASLTPVSCAGTGRDCEPHDDGTGPGGCCMCGLADRAGLREE
jgi:hypothetical protein